MAQGNGVVYNEFKKELLAGNIDLDSHTLRVALVYGYTPNIDSHNGWSDVSSAQCSGANYTAGGATLASLSVTKNTSTDKGVFDAVDVTWSSLALTTPANGTPSHAILYDDTHASDCLIAYWEVTTPTNGGNYTLQFNVNGILTLA